MKLVFFAKILPERFPLTAPTSKYSGSVEKFGFSYSADLSIYAGQAIAQITIDGTDADIFTIKNIIEDSIRSFVDYYGFVHGVRFDVDMTAVIDGFGNWTVFGIDIPVLKKNTVEQRDELLRKYLATAVTKVECSIVMADFREAMRNPTNTGFYCYRAVEAMMQAMKNDPAERDDKAWEKLRDNLRVDRACLDNIKLHADPPRHGKPHAMTDAERAYVFEKSQAIIFRYLEYLTRGEKQLPEAEFPSLPG